MFLYFLTLADKVADQDENVLQWLRITLDTNGNLEKIALLNESATQVINQDAANKLPLLAYDFQTKGYVSFTFNENSSVFMRYRYNPGTKRHLYGEAPKISSGNVCWNLVMVNNKTIPIPVSSQESLERRHTCYTNLSTVKIEDYQKQFDNLIIMENCQKQFDNLIINDDIPCEAIKLHSEQLLTTLAFQTTNKLSLLAYLAEYAEPSLFCAIVVTLLKIGETPQTILKTGILGAFFKQQITNIDDVRRVYKWLKALQGDYSNLEELCRLAAEHKITLSENDAFITPSMAQLALNGACSEENKKSWKSLSICPHKILIPLHITESKDNLTSLYNAFGKHFFYLCLTQSTEQCWEKLEQNLSIFLNTLPQKEMYTLMEDYLLNVVETNQMERFLLLCKALDNQKKEAFQEILIEKYLSKLMCCDATLREFVTADLVDKKMKGLVITRDNISDVSAFAYNPEFKNYHAQLHKKIAEFLFSLPAGEREIFHQEAEALQASTHLLDWVKNETCKLYEALVKIAPNKCELTDDSFAQLDIAYKNYVSAISFFKSIVDEDEVPQERPTTRQDFQAWVLENTAKFPSIFDLGQALNVIFRYLDENYSLDEKIRARIKCLKACKNSNLVQNFLQLLLNNQFKLHNNTETITIESLETATVETLLSDLGRDFDSYTLIINRFSQFDVEGRTFWEKFDPQQLLGPRLNTAVLELIVAKFSQPDVKGKTLWEKLNLGQLHAYLKALNLDQNNNKAMIELIVTKFSQPNDAGNTLWEKFNSLQLSTCLEFLGPHLNTAIFELIIAKFSQPDVEGRTFWEKFAPQQLLGPHLNTAVLELIVAKFSQPDVKGKTLWEKLNLGQLHAYLKALSLGQNNDEEKKNAMIELIVMKFSQPNDAGNTLWEKFNSLQLSTCLEFLGPHLNTAMFKYIVAKFSQPDVEGNTLWEKINLTKLPWCLRFLSLGQNNDEEKKNAMIELIAEKFSQPDNAGKILWEKFDSWQFSAYSEFFNQYERGKAIMSLIQQQHTIKNTANADASSNASRKRIWNDSSSSLMFKKTKLDNNIDPTQPLQRSTALLQRSTAPLQRSTAPLRRLYTQYPGF